MTNVKITKMGINGEGIAYINRKPVFIPGALVEETVDITVTEDNERYARGEVNQIITPSKHRIVSPCADQSVCGGCPLFIMEHSAQLNMKKKLLEEALYKYAGVRREFIRDMHSNHLSTGYRNQCKMPVEESHKKLTSGMYTTGSNHYKPIAHCPVQDPLLEKTRAAIIEILDQAGIKEYDLRTEHGLRYIVIRSIDEHTQATLITGKDSIHSGTIEKIMALEGMTSLFQSINTNRKGIEIFGSNIRKLAGEEQIFAKVNGITIALSPRSFFQLNLKQAEDMYKMAVSKIDPCDVLVEAYAGAGAMSLMANRKAKKVIGIESVPEAVENAKQNAELNNIENATFICADAAEGLNRVSSRYHVNTLLADPPRSGMSDEMIEAILKAAPEKIIYVSCNPATLARNIKALKQSYQLMTVIPYDLFPNTAHVESISVLVKNGTPTTKKTIRARNRRKHRAEKK